MKTIHNNLTTPANPAPSTPEPAPNPDSPAANPPIPESANTITPPPPDPQPSPLPLDPTPPADPSIHYPLSTINSSRSRSGKIARLPNLLREQLNSRLQDGEPLESLLLWLNPLPEVQSLLNDHFDARPINHVNLVAWKAGGYRDWLVRQDALALADSLTNQDSLGHQALAGSFTDKLAHWIALQFAAATRQLDPPDANPHAYWARLRQLCADISRLRRNDLAAHRLDLDRQRLAVEKQNADFLREKEFWAWTERPEIREKLFPDEVKGLTPETLAKIEKELNLL